MDLDERAMENERRLNHLAQTVAIIRETNRINEKTNEKTVEKLGLLSDGQHQIVAQQAKISDKVDSAAAAITTMRAELDARKEESIQNKTRDVWLGRFWNLITTTGGLGIIAAILKLTGFTL